LMNRCTDNPGAKITIEETSEPTTTLGFCIQSSYTITDTTVDGDPKTYRLELTIREAEESTKIKVTAHWHKENGPVSELKSRLDQISPGVYDAIRTFLGMEGLGYETSYTGYIGKIQEGGTYRGMKGLIITKEMSLEEMRMPVPEPRPNLPFNYVSKRNPSCRPST